jgi:hypothetical protein
MTMERVTSHLPLRAQRIVVLRDAHDVIQQLVCVWFDIASSTPCAKELCLDEKAMLLLHGDLQANAIGGVTLYEHTHLLTLQTGIPGLRRSVQRCSTDGGSVSIAGTTQQLYDTVVQYGQD